MLNNVVSNLHITQSSKNKQEIPFKDGAQNLSGITASLSGNTLCTCISVYCPLTIGIYASEEIR